MATLESRLRAELENWRKRLPEAWRSRFENVELNFAAVDAGTMLAENEHIWPQETNPGGPVGAHVFKALQDLRPEEIRVVIFGNDPYTQLNQATGRSFEQGNLTSWTPDPNDLKSRFSPSLKTLLAAALATSGAGAKYPLVDRRVVFNPDEFKYDPNDKWGKWNYGPNPLWLSHLALELCLLSGEVNVPSPQQIFAHWSKQGVLWINRTLTYTKWETDVGQPGHRRSHQRVWAPFTDRLIDTLIEGTSSDHRVHFALWGGEAKEIGELVKKKAQAAGKTDISFTQTGHPQRPENYFLGADKPSNPLAEINKTIQGAPIEWI
ncbi:MAG TPA: hypothetical protein VN643_04820 [Pyrinomonadaceae bacterium]|nr:hypothetical protein [Pyrinomonadaceae bacterium]